MPVPEICGETTSNMIKLRTLRMIQNLTKAQLPSILYPKVFNGALIVSFSHANVLKHGLQNATPRKSAYR